MGAKLYRAGQDYAKSVSRRRGAYDDLNIDPYANRPIRAGQRQEDASDILAHGERSDTNWDKVIKQNVRALKKAYHSSEGGWARTKDMDATSRLLYEASVRPRGAEAFAGEKLRAPGSQISEKHADRGVRAATAEEWSEFQSQATKANEESMAKWMAEYNKQTNQSERIAQSEQRTKYRERFADMRIANERKQRKQTRTTLRRGASGLSTGSGAGVGLGI